MKNVVAENLDLTIDSDLFSPLSTEEKKADDVIRPSVGYWANAFLMLAMRSAICSSVQDSLISMEMVRLMIASDLGTETLV